LSAQLRPRCVYHAHPCGSSGATYCISQVSHALTRADGTFSALLAPGSYTYKLDPDGSTAGCDLPRTGMSLVWP
jgi:hypothetical protein